MRGAIVAPIRDRPGARARDRIGFVEGNRPGTVTHELHFGAGASIVGRHAPAGRTDGFRRRGGLAQERNTMRTPGSRQDTTWPVIRETSIALIYEHGFESMSTRQLAEVVDMKPGSLYYYFSSKEELLSRLVTEVLEEIVTDLEHRLEGEEDGLTRLDTFVSGLVEWHVTRHRETYIALMDVRSLSDEKRAQYMASRDRYDHLLQAILEQCRAEGVIADIPLRVARLSLLTMITGITSWYKESGETSLTELQSFYVSSVRRFVGARSEAERT
jgi:AcrR family transcriptional regulator